MKTKSISLILAALSLTACGITQRAHEKVTEFETKTDTLLKEQANYKAAPISPPRRALVNDGFWVDTNPVRATASANTRDLPPVLYQDIVIGRSGSPGLLEIATLLTKTSGISVGFAPDAAQIITQNQGKNGLTDVLPYQGRMMALLDLIGSRNNLFWRWTGERVEFFQHETRSFVIAALAGNMELKSEVAAQQQAPLAGSNAQQSTSGNKGITMNSKGSVWDSVKDAVTAMKSSKGLIAVTEATGMITVTDTPTVLRQVEAYVKTVNDALGKQVLVTVDVYAVNGKEEENFAISWDLIYTQLSRTLKLGYAGGGLVGPATNNWTILSDPNGDSKWAGSQAIIGALSQLGRTVMLTNATVVTMSGQPVPVQVTRETSYLAQVTSGTGTIISGSTGPTLTPGVVTTGFALNVLPRVMEDGDVLLQYALDISNLDDLSRVSSGGNSIQVPIKSNRNFLSRINMRSGQSLVLGGLKMINAASTRQGPFSPSAWMFGGSDSSRLDQAYLVVVITPRILDRS